MINFVFAIKKANKDVSFKKLNIKLLNKELMCLKQITLILNSYSMLYTSSWLNWYSYGHHMLEMNLKSLKHNKYFVNIGYTQYALI